MSSGCGKYIAAEQEAPRAELPEAPSTFGVPVALPEPPKPGDRAKVHFAKLINACEANIDRLELDRQFYEMVRQKFSAVK